MPIHTHSRTVTRVATRARRVWPITILLGALLLAPKPGRASHYPLNAIDIASSDETYALFKAGVTDTKELLAQAGSKAGRAALAKKVGISTKRLLALARLCDLMQVRGVGPTVARLLQRCDILDLAAFKKRKLSEAAAISACMEKKNKEQPITELIPSADFLETWLQAAASLESRLD